MAMNVLYDLFLHVGRFFTPDILHSDQSRARLRGGMLDFFTERSLKGSFLSPHTH